MKPEVNQQFIMLTKKAAVEDVQPWIVCITSLRTCDAKAPSPRI